MNPLRHPVFRWLFAAQIMSLLGMKVGAVAVTKIDLVDEDMRELVVEDVRGLLEGTFLEGAPLFPVSSTTGEGVPELRTGLEGRTSSALEGSVVILG